MSMNCDIENSEVLNILDVLIQVGTKHEFSRTDNYCQQLVQ